MAKRRAPASAPERRERDPAGFCQRPNTSSRLFAGIACRACRAQPRFARLRFDLRQRADARGRIALAEALVEGKVARRRRHALLEIRPVGEQHATRAQMPRRPLHQRGTGGPRRDVQHVRAVDRIEILCEGRALRRPGGVEHIEQHGLPEAGQAGLFDAACERGKRARIGIAGLPAPAGQGGREPLGMLSGARGDLERGALPAEDAEQPLEDRLLVAFGGGTEGQVGHAVLGGEGREPEAISPRPARGSRSPRRAAWVRTCRRRARSPGCRPA